MFLEFSQFIGRVPKESYDLLRRNIEIRKVLEKIYRDYKAGIEINPADFDFIFDEIFRYFFRPLELAIANTMLFSFLLPDRKNIRLLESFSEVFQTYDNFLKSLKDHLRLTFSIFERDGMSSWVEEFEEFFERYKAPEIYDFNRSLSEYFFALPNKALKHISESFEAWERFGGDYFNFKNLLMETYRSAVKEFINTAKTKKFESHSYFASEFYDTVARKFDDLLKSEEYLKVQNSMISNLMDHFYHFRKFAEEWLENTPLNPFATVSQIDEAYKRITDLRRKILELENKIEEIKRR
uniref:Uncharacterized protein n=1 Tax=Archaeoglobus fulgidus TaxID=2234 RepID=A0A7C3MA86_ARCFL